MYYTVYTVKPVRVIPQRWQERHALPLAGIFQDCYFANQSGKHGYNLIFRHFIPIVRLYIVRL